MKHVSSRPGEDPLRSSVFGRLSNVRHGVAAGPLQGATFLLAPLGETALDVLRWLVARRCVQLRVYRGPDGLWRGSGRVE